MPMVFYLSHLLTLIMEFLSSLATPGISFVELRGGTKSALGVAQTAVGPLACSGVCRKDAKRLQPETWSIKTPCMGL